MARIDRFIEALFQRGGERLELAGGEQVRLVVGGTSRPLSSSTLHAKILADFAREIVPADLAADLDQDGEHAFRYAAPAGAVQVNLKRAGESLGMELVPEPATPAGSASSQPRPPQARASRAGGAGGGDMEALLRELVEQGCSDLHLTSGNPPLFRKDGQLVPLSRQEPLAPERVRDLIDAITPPQRREQFEECGDADFGHEIPDLARFRCNLFVDRLGAGAVFRVIPATIPTAQDLGLSPPILRLCDLSKGLVVVTGPTGSGKSTTLAAMIDHINRSRADHIITIEDPVEFVHPNRKCLVNQREIGTHTRGFKSALRAALREDPDIVLVGELRDLETVEIAIETAETGHLVFATLHTNTAASTVDRIIDQFPTDRQGQIRTMLSASLRGVIAQTLCRKIGGGRVAAQEVLIVNPAVSNLIREGKTFQIPSVMQAGKAQGMTTLNDALLTLVAEEKVEPDQACAKAVAREELRKTLEARGIPLSGGSA